MQPFKITIQYKLNHLLHYSIMKKLFFILSVLALPLLKACQPQNISPMDETFDDKPPKTNCGGAMCDEGD